jgi:adenosylhomocysteine nucleosidase
MKILAIAAEALEINPWLRLCAQPTPLSWPIAHAHQTHSNGATLHIIANGPGPRLSRQALYTALEKAGPFDTILSIGLCGALNPELTIKSICTATEVTDGATTWPARPFPGAQPVKLLSIDKFLGHPAEKRKWAEKGLGIVEMEAAPLAQYAAEHNIPFYAIKIVSDLAHEHFALDFNQYRDPAGRFQIPRIALAACAHPFQYMPDLFRLASRGRAASEILGVFLAHARF